MRFSSELNKRAKEIRIEAAKRFGGIAKDYNWQEAVSLASKGFEFKPLESIEKQAKKHTSVMSWTNFKTKNGIDRLYLNLYGEKSYRGDRTSKLYFDRKTQEFVFEPGKGRTSSKFDESVESFAETFAVEGY